MESESFRFYRFPTGTGPVEIILVVCYTVYFLPGSESGEYGFAV